MRILFATGGTAGHINPALAVASFIRETQKDSKILFIGTSDHMEARLVPNAGFDFKTILDAHKKLKDKDFTDDSGMLEYLGLEVYALQGSQTNKKITFREDLD